MSEHNSHPTYRSDIDGLRALAILPVVAYHAFPQYAKGGFVGVDIFFVISGYLISLILFKSLMNNDFVFTEFYARRIKRIFPALILVTGSCYAIGWFSLLPDEFKQLGKHIAAGMGFAQNLVLWQETGYFDIASEQKPLMHLWSLAVEEQFYLIYPLLLWSAWKARLNILIGVVLLGSISYFLSIKGVHEDPVRTFFAPDTRFWELLAGTVLAYINAFRAWRTKIFDRVFFHRLPAEEVREASLTNILSVIGMALVIFSIAVYDHNTPYPGSRALAPVLGAALLILAGPRAWVNRKLLANKAAVWIGLISYPLYLWHWPILSFARIVEFGELSPEIRIVAVVISFILASLTYYFIEKPIRYGRPTWLITTILCVLATVIGYIGYNTYSKNGLPFRVEKTLANNPMFSDEHTPWLAQNQDKRCTSKYPKFADQYCRMSRNGDPTIQIIGDSHALSFFPGMRDLSNNVENVFYMGAGGCMPLLNVATLHNEKISEADHTKNRCMSYANLAIEIAGKNNTHTVILWFSDQHYNDPNVRLFSVTHPELTDKSSIMKVGLRETLDHLIAQKKKLVFVLDNPELGFDPKSCAETRPLRLTNNLRKPCAIPRKQFDEISLESRDLVMSVLKDYPSIKVLDPAAQLCDQQWCWAIKDGKMLYRDDDHLSLDGAKLIASELIKLLD